MAIKRPSPFLNWVNSQAGVLTKIISTGVLVFGCLGWFYQRVQNIDKYLAADKQFKQEISFQLVDIKNELAFSQVTQKFLMEQDNVMWFIVDSNGLTIEVSPAALKFLKVSFDEVSGTNWFNHIPKEEHYYISKEFKESLLYKRDFKFSYHFMKGDQTSVVLDTYGKWCGSKWFGILRPKE